MKSSKLEKVYPELNGLSSVEQHKIVERAKDEIKKGKTVFLGLKAHLVCAIISLVAITCIYFALPSDDWLGPFSGWRFPSSIAIIFIYSFWHANKRDIKLIQPKVRELVQNEKI